MAAVSQTMIDNARCYENCVPPGMAWYLILAQLLNGGSVASPQALIDQAGCLICTVPPGLVPYLILGQLASGGVGNPTGNYNPNGVLSGSNGQMYTQVVGSGAGAAVTIWVNTDGGTTWV